MKKPRMPAVSGWVTAAGRDTDGDVVAAGEGAQGDGDGGCDHGELGCSRCPGGLGDGLGGQLEGNGRAAVCGAGGAGVIGRQVQFGCSGESVTPVGEPGLGGGRTALPVGEVTVLEGGFGGGESACGLARRSGGRSRPAGV